MGSGPFLIHTGSDNIVSFNGATVFTIGRSGDCNLDIAAIYISRKQCRIEYLRNVGWVLFDESRFKTTKLNNESISSIYAVLNDGDKISFAPNSCSHEYAFYSDAQEITRKKRKREEGITQVNDRVKTATSDETVDTERMSPLDLLREMATQSSFSLLSPKKNRDEEYEKIKKENIMLELQLKRSKEHLEDNNMSVCLLETENINLRSQLEKVEQKNKELMDSLIQLRSTAEQDVTRLELANSEQRLLELKSKSLQTDVENSELKETISDAEKEIESLLKERCCKIINFGSELKNNGEASMDSLTEVELSLMKADLKELMKKNSELTTNLEQVRLEKDDFSVKVNDIIDSELYCSICSDLMYQAVTLQCKHTFCKMCIEEWKKKKRECPVCRTKVKTQVPCLVVDSFIDKVADTIGGEIKTRRLEIIKERTEAAAAAATPRSNKRKRSAAHVPIPPFPPLDPIIEHLELGFAGPVPWENPFPVGPFFDVVDLTRGSPPHPPFRGFERHGRRRRR